MDQYGVMQNVYVRAANVKLGSNHFILVEGGGQKIAWIELFLTSVVSSMNVLKSVI